ncbi:hypothetical protein nbrc107696_38140 [Gordonia spumicola]|uniref:Peptidase MA-like domain-containing protein n=1 Tax=Gordonia spumicola TaxID=589161 RepID=A0A7I9VDD1_9ACTN|nr:hypothetical protein [Gordonia spumicola]GEE03368.1 hypothetical protein nbrc107696_38140 [Gordonia spumicola]
MSTHRGNAALAVVVAAAVSIGGLSACSAADDASPASSAASSTPLNPFEQQRSDGVTALLDQLSSVLKNGDTAGLDALIDASAPAGFRARMHTIASSFAAKGDRDKRGGPLSASTFSYRLAPNTGSERLLGADWASRLEAQGSTDTWVNPVELSYSLGGEHSPGLAEPVVTLSETMTFARYDDDWKVVGDGTLALDPTPTTIASPGPAEVGPWEYRGLAASDVVTAGGVSTVLSYPKTDVTVANARKILPAAVRAVDEFWGDGWQRRAAVVATGDSAEFAGLTRTKAADTTVAAAATVFSRIDKQARQVIGQRIVLSPNAGSLSEPALAVVLRHELMHVATRLITAENAPLWLTEGVPEYVGRRGTYREFVDAAPELAAAVAGGDVPKTLPADSTFAVDSDAARVAYQSAWSFAAFIADKFGDAKLKALYVGVAKGGDTPTQDAAIRSAVGQDKSTLVTQWQAWLKEKVR